MSKKVSIDEALKLGERTPPRQITGFKRSLNPGSPPDTTSRPESIMEVDLPTPKMKKMAFDASAEDRQPKNKGGKSRRRKTKKARKTRRRRSRK
jgi:hypothetical protein